MIKKHPRTTEAHDGSNPISHIRTIAVHRAFVALGLGITKLAVIQTGQRVIKQFPALTAQLLPAVVLPAPQFNHMEDRSLLPGKATHTHNSQAMLLGRSAVSLTFSTTFSTDI